MSDETEDQAEEPQAPELTESEAREALAKAKAKTKAKAVAAEEKEFKAAVNRKTPPAQDPKLGEKTPVFIAWMKKNRPDEYAEKFANWKNK